MPDMLAKFLIFFVVLSDLFLCGPQRISASSAWKCALTQRTQRYAEDRREAQTNLPSLSVEVFPVLDLPLTIHEASLLKTDKGYFLKLSLGNSADVAIIGLRYSLATINSENQVQIRVNRTEGFSIPEYATKRLTFKTPIKLKLKDGERLVLMLEQVVSPESIWEVVKAKEALEAYANGDYSVRPAVMRVGNQVDVPLVPLMVPRPDEE